MRLRTASRAIVLCLALLGPVTAGAGEAQAEAGSYWLVNGVKVTTLLPELQGALEFSDGELLGSIGGTKIHVSCAFLSLGLGNHLLAEGGWLGKGVFSGCSVARLTGLGFTEPLPACTPIGGSITTTASKGLIRLSLGSPIIVLEPNVGTTLATISMGEECALGEAMVIGGKFAIRDCENAFLNDKVTHLVEEEPFKTELFINGNKTNKATLHGSALIKLTWTHEGLTWAGHPA